MSLKNGLNCLSLFDGISCGMVALERAGFKVDEYHAFEIDKYAIQISQKNYPDIIRHGSVVGADFSQFKDISLLMAGSPCQGFSFAGKQLNFNDPRSALFFEFVRALKVAKPKYFMLENVKMKKEYQRVISDHLGVEPIEINSALVSAQNRKRLYWTNIPDQYLPNDKNILIKDILEGEPDEKYFLSSTMLNGSLRNNKAFNGRFKAHGPDEKSQCLTARYYKMGKTDPYIDQLKVVNYSSSGRLNGEIEGRYYETEKGNTLTASGYSSKSSTAIYQVDPSIDSGGKQPYMQDRIYHVDGKSVSLTAGFANRLNVSGGKLELVRRLTPIECERLQTLPDRYTEGVSDTQRYKALGNGWTVDVVAHIFKGMKDASTPS